MSALWTTEQILAMASDPASAQAGKGLASPRKWVTTGHDARAVWGECQGSGSKPYQVQVDLSEPAFRCSCPSRKFPCKHGLGLLLLYAGDPKAVAEATPPGWVAEWLEKRGEKAEKAARPAAEKTGEELAKAAAEQAKRAAQREKRVAAGLADLDLWLRDLVRQGLGAAQSRPLTFWEEMAARMVDAQAPGVARMLREMATLPASGEGWTDRLMDRVGRLYLLLEGYRRLETLSEPNQADVRSAVGWTMRQEEVLAAPGVTDTWLLPGQYVYDDEYAQVRVQRTWLRGQYSGRDALLLSFARPGQPLEAGLMPGACFEAEVAYFPGAYPQRALLKERRSAAQPLDRLPAYQDFAAMLSAYADALACNPWLETFPAPLAGMVPLRREGRWLARDAGGALLPLSETFRYPWRLLALSGGRPMTLFGEWDGAALLPLAAWTGERYLPFAADSADAL